MNSTAQRSRSPWMLELPKQAPKLAADIETDVVVVGAGLSGLTAAYMLAQAGKRVTVIDSGAPGGGMTARTSAHLTNALDDRWYELIKLRGEEEAKLAAAAHSAAIDKIEHIQHREGIACDFMRVDGYLILAGDDKIKLLHEERDAAHRVGLSDVVLEERCAVAGKEAPALRFPRQGRFHPLKYLRGLITCIERDGGQFYSGRVVSIESGKKTGVTTDGGFEMKAKHIVMATNVPIDDIGDVQDKQTPFRSYVIAGFVPKGAVTDALIWDTGWPYHYVRLQPSSDDTRDILIVGGEDHKSGEANDTAERFTHLEVWSRKHFPALKRITWRWSGQVMETGDCLALMGRNTDREKNVFIMSGDTGLGMTHATIGAMIIVDQIDGRLNVWEKLFDPSRTPPDVTEGRAKTKKRRARKKTILSIEDIPPGSGAVIIRGKQKIAAYKYEDSTVVEHSAICTHAGCTVAWNGFEKCWDCPCHGSQFSAQGAVINGPATRDLEAIEGEPKRKTAQNQQQPSAR